MDRMKISKVHVVFKTHLDIGFTNMAQTVLDCYQREYIPHSVDLALALNTDTEKKFIWTVGSYLIDYYLRNGSKEDCDKLVRAIKRGDICWHGLACTTHTELLDRDLLDYDLEVADRLDERFGRKTIAAKMTDVPGHTKALVEALYDHGIAYLHIGVNASSMVPNVPLTFVWKSGDKDVMVQYSFEYGAPCYVEGMDEVLEFAHTGDNLGPQSAEAIAQEMARIQERYPNACIVASTMDEYAKSLLNYKECLPVVEEEIGDTWIHGIATDPLKVSQYRALVQLKNRWIQEGKITRSEESFHSFYRNLLLVAEHTWGLDYKKYLADFTNWRKEDFQAARKADVTTLDFLTNRNANMLAVLQEDFVKYRGGSFTGSYRLYESSHEEQRLYLKKAVQALPDSLREEAEAELKRLEDKSSGDPILQDIASDARTIAPYEHVSIGSWCVAFDGTGAIVYLDKDGHKWITDGCFGRFSYETYHAQNCVENYYSYNRDFRENQCWSEGDFSKPGLEFVEDLEHRNYQFGAVSILQTGTTIQINLAGSHDAVSRYGCPAKAQITYQFEEEITVSLSWRQKDANRMPEALWLDMNFDVENVHRWKMQKMGVLVSPLDVVKGGNRRQHCVESMYYDGADGTITITNHHSPLISIGGRWLYGDYRPQPDLRQGFSYNLFNNKWGTNFKMWCEDNCYMQYTLTLQNK